LNELGQYENALKHQQKYLGNHLKEFLLLFSVQIIICLKLWQRVLTTNWKFSVLLPPLVGHISAMLKH
jgi:hypothetical protein